MLSRKYGAGASSIHTKKRRGLRAKVPAPPKQVGEPSPPSTPVAELLPSFTDVLAKKFSKCKSAMVGEAGFEPASH